LRTAAELLAERGLHGLSIEEGGTSRAHPETGAAEALAGRPGRLPGSHTTGNKPGGMA
jgi:hypothetical protein